MLNRKILSVLMLCAGMFLAPKAKAEILQVKTFEGLKAHIEENKYTPSDMVVFDVDMVLTMPQNPILQMPALKKYKKDFRDFISSFPRKKRDAALLYGIMLYPQIPTHPDMPKLVEDLQQQKVMIRFLTALPTGQFKSMATPAEWRLHSLLSAGYNIPVTQGDGRVYTEFVKHSGGYPMRAGHLLLSNGGQYGGVTKGDLLVFYLKEMSLAPTRLVMIDDRLKNLESIEAELTKKFPGIKFIGIHYLGAGEVKAPKVTAEEFKEVLRRIGEYVKKDDTQS